MGLDTYYSSDYGSMESSTSWGNEELNWHTFQSQLQTNLVKGPKASSYADLISGKCTLKDVMMEFRQNGSDAPFDPEDQQWTPQTNLPAYGRQQSWPGTERTTRRHSMNYEAVPVSPAPAPVIPPAPGPAALSEEQWQVINSLPDSVLLTLLRELQRRQKWQPEDCRFCKNNGERESFYRSHSLKDGAGRVACPVLRAFVCKRCGARGDSAHTVKYCPLSTHEERAKSTAMMRSVRKASAGRRRSLQLQAPPACAGQNYPYYGALSAPLAAPPVPSSVLDDYNSYAAVRESAPLDPQWAALEQKLERPRMI